MAAGEAAERPNKLVRMSRSTWQFLVDTRFELRKVTWPTWPELNDATKRVLIMTLAIGIALGVLDRALQFILVDGIAAIAR